MTSPRCSVEHCLALGGGVVLIAGWLFEPEPGKVVVLSGREGFRDDVTSRLVRLDRPDVVAAFAEAYPEEAIERNRRAGFIALATEAEPNESGVFLLSISSLSSPSGTDGDAPLVVEVLPHPFTGDLDEPTRGYLRHSMRPLLEALRGQEVLGKESLRALLTSLGDGFADDAVRPAAGPPSLRPALRREATSAGDGGAPSKRASSLEAPGERDAETAHSAFESAADGVAAAVDHVYFVPCGGVFVVGWLLDADDRIRAIQTHHEGGVATSALDETIRVSRPDVEREYGSWHRERSSDRFGFAFYAELPGATHQGLESSLHFTLMTDSGPYRSVRPSRVQNPPPNPLPIIREMLTMAPPGDARALFKHLGPAVESLWKHRAVLRERPVPVEVGEPVAQPAISVIVPVHGRHDLIEYQLSLFADDPDFRSAELIYVVDDPRIGSEVLSLCRDVQPLFRVPCRVILCARNHGFAGATNIGAASARGRLLVLLDSDVMPREKGWLGKLRAIYDALPGRGALAPKLLFPDGSLQHVGIGFEQLASYPGLWVHTHPGKGYPGRSEGTGSAVPVAAVTTACLMVDKDLYDEVGGLDEGYIIGDVEDSDFCLKLRARGSGSYYAPSVELYHLELRAQNLEGSTDWRASLNLHNAWRMTLRWSDEIQRLSRGHR